MQFNGPTVASAQEADKPSEFLRTDIDGNPARWNPCAPLKWKMVGAGSSDATRNTVSAAMRALMDATGLDFVYEKGGVVSELRNPPANTLVVGVALKNTNIRVAGTTRVKYDASLEKVIRIESATVTLNPDIFRLRARSFNFVLPVLLHELGHAVGLSHVDDPTDIMYPKIVNRTQYQQSDLVKLARVGVSKGCLS